MTSALAICCVLCLSWFLHSSLAASFDSALVEFSGYRVDAYSRPRCVSQSYGILDCFLRGEDAHVYHLMKRGSQREAANLGGAVKDEIECLATPEGIFLLALDHDNALIWMRQSHGNWSAWTSLGESLQEVPSCVVRNQEVVCMARGNDGVAATIEYKSGRWSGWSKISGVLGGPPDCTVDARDVVHCFALADVNVPQRVFKQAEWSQWEKLEGYPKCKGRPEAFSVDGRATSAFIDFKHQPKIVDASGGAKLPEGEAKLPISCVDSHNGQYFCFGVGLDAYLYRLEGDDYINSWFADGYVEGPSCVRTNKDEITCLVRSIGNSIREVVYRSKLYEKESSTELPREGEERESETGYIPGRRLSWGL